jgi:8-oxo-dGTP pyrophosphatase MutT (NUDIX family)
MDRIDLDLVRARLSAAGPPRPLGDATARAAVAVVLRDLGGGADVLLIRRAEDPRDPWSGHMAFPGGRQDPSDPDLLATALRETREEIGLSLAEQGEPIGQLPDLPAIARGRPVGLVISPFVFALRGAPELSPNDEVAEIHWSPIAPLLRGERRTSFPYVHEGKRFEFPAHRVADRVVWGLTHQMLESFFALLRR